MEAFNAVVEEISLLAEKKTAFLGDIVGYGPSPNEVIQALDVLRVHSIRGNHDRYALGENSDLLRTATAEAVDYTRQQLTPASRAVLEALKDTLMFDDRILLVHGSPRDRDEYILTQEGAVASYRHFCAHYGGIYLCLFGHTHLPTVVGDGKVVHDIPSGYTLKLKMMTPYLVNAGSVGQPRDGNPDAAYAVLDVTERTLTFRRVRYDVEDTRRRVLEAGLQRHLGDRLLVGR